MSEPRAVATGPNNSTKLDDPVATARGSDTDYSLRARVTRALSINLPLLKRNPLLGKAPQMRTQKNLFPDDKLCSLLSLFTSESKSGLAIGRSRSYLLARGHSTTCREGGAHHASESLSRKSVKAISRSGVVHRRQHGVWPERGFYLSGPAHRWRHRGKRHLRYAVQVVRHGHRRHRNTDRLDHYQEYGDGDERSVHGRSRLWLQRLSGCGSLFGDRRSRQRKPEPLYRAGAATTGHLDALCAADDLSRVG